MKIINKDKLVAQNMDKKISRSRPLAYAEIVLHLFFVIRVAKYSLKSKKRFLLLKFRRF